ncbi:MAG: hypothetical protein ACLTX3_04915 [Lachnospiraceae bacterium]
MAYYMNKSVPAKRGDIFYISNSKCYATDPSNTEEDQQSLSPLIN